jgi:tetratricopeptide (TPR) repeat protein
MKALEKDRNRRYETASAFAADVQRYLKDEPVQACPPSAAYRLRKFVRRNRTAVAATVSGVALLLLAVLGLTVSYWRITQEQALTVKERNEAEANFRKARQAVDDQFTLVSESKLFNAPGFQSLRKDLLESALKYYEDFLRQRPGDPELQAEVAAAHLRLYQIYEAIDGSYSPGSIQQLEQGVAIVEQLLRGPARDPGLYIRLAGFAKGGPSLHGGYSAAGAQVPASVLIPLFQRIAAIWEDFVRDHPSEVGFQCDLCAFYSALQETQASVGQPAEALANIRKALAFGEKIARENPKDPEYRSQLVWMHDAFGSRLRQAGPPEEVESHYRRALELSQILADECPQVPEYRAVLAGAHHTLGSWLTETGRPQKAEEAYRQGVILQEKLVIDFPKMPAYRHSLASFHESLGHFYRDAGKTEKAENAYREALKNWDKLAEEFPTNANYRVPFSAFCLCLLLAAGDREEEADRIYRRVLEFKPETPDGQNYLAWRLAAFSDTRFGDRKLALELAQKAAQQAPDAGYIWNTLGVAHYRNGNWREAVVALDKAMQHGSGGDSVDRFFLAMAHWRLGDKEQARQWYALGVHWMEKNEQHSMVEELRQELTRFRAEAAKLLDIEEQPRAKEKEKPHAKGPSPQ